MSKILLKIFAMWCPPGYGGCGWRGQTDKRIRKCPRCGRVGLRCTGKFLMTVTEFSVCEEMEK